MAERRMFSKTVIDSDCFLDMPLTAQALYFHLAMRADDDGFINNPKSIMRNVCCKDDDLKMLIQKEFIIAFESGIVVIRHWKIHNYIRKDRYNPTANQEEMERLIQQKDGRYTIGIPNDNQRLTDGCHRLGEDRSGKVRLVQREVMSLTAQHARTHQNPKLMENIIMFRLQTSNTQTLLKLMGKVNLTNISKRLMSIVSRTENTMMIMT